MAILWTAGSEFNYEYGNGIAKPVKVLKPTYDGVVLGTTGRDERIMSDVWAWITYAKVWDGTKVIDVPIKNSEFGDYGTATIDATDAVKSAVAAWEAAEAAKRAEAARLDAIARVMAEAGRVGRGKTVIVVKGRKLPKGFTGRVFWLGDTKYGRRVGIETADGKREFTAIGNVEVVDPASYADKDYLASLKAA